MRALAFSPDGKYFAVAVGPKMQARPPLRRLDPAFCFAASCAVHSRSGVQVWTAPGLVREFAPLKLHRTYTGHFGEIRDVHSAPSSPTIARGFHNVHDRCAGVPTRRSS